LYKNVGSLSRKYYRRVGDASDVTVNDLTVQRHALLLKALLCLVGLQGCGLGALIYGDTARTVDHPFLVEQSSSTSDRVRRIGQSPSPETLSAERLQLEWGLPGRIEQVSGDLDTERWTYWMERLRWHGPLLIVVVVPVPLLVPFGHDYTVFTIQRGTVLDATEVRSRPKYGGFCGVPIVQALMLQAPPFVCTAGAVRLTEP
jgi:hypothetical protein